MTTTQLYKDRHENEQPTTTTTNSSRRVWENTTCNDNDDDDDDNNNGRNCFDPQKHNPRTKSKSPIRVKTMTQNTLENCKTSSPSSSSIGNVQASSTTSTTTLENKTKQAFQAIGKFSTKTKQQINEVFLQKPKHPFHSMNSFGDHKAKIIKQKDSVTFQQDGSQQSHHHHHHHRDHGYNIDTSSSLPLQSSSTSQNTATAASTVVSQEDCNSSSMSLMDIKEETEEDLDSRTCCTTTTTTKFGKDADDDDWVSPSSNTGNYYFVPDGTSPPTTTTTTDSCNPTTDVLCFFVLPDTYVVWAIIGSILLFHVYDHWEQLWYDHHCSWETILHLMLLAFAIGSEVDQEEVLEELKLRLLGIDNIMEVHEEATWENSHRVYQRYREQIIQMNHQQQQNLKDDDDNSKKKKQPFFKRMFRKRASRKKKTTTPMSRLKTFTSLNLKLSNLPFCTRNGNKAMNNQHLRKRVSQYFATKQQQQQRSSSVETPNHQPMIDTQQQSFVSHSSSSSSSSSSESDIFIGETSLRNARAVDLLEDVPMPLCCVRGLDLFRTEDPDPDIITHPFLVKHGLRNFPTFVINILTLYGNIVVYFKLPDWVEDWDDSLIETDDDPSDVIALKRFLKGDEAYKIKCFKIMPELVNGPLPVKFLAPHNRAFPLNFQGYLSTTYSQLPPTPDQSPVMCLTLDLVSNSTIRSMVGIFRRNMHRMTVDYACIIDPDTEGEPSCILGLWRMDHMDVEEYPYLPCRYTEEEDGMDPDKADSIRASLLVKRISDVYTMKQSMEQATREEVSEDKKTL